MVILAKGVLFSPPRGVHALSMQVEMGLAFMTHVMWTKHFWAKSPSDLLQAYEEVLIQIQVKTISCTQSHQFIVYGANSLIASAPFDQEPFGVPPCFTMVEGLDLFQGNRTYVYDDRM